MERFVELSHREEEDEEDIQAGGGGGGGDGAMYNTTNNNNSVGSFETNGNADRRMMEHSKSHPRMLKSTFFLFSLSLSPVLFLKKNSLFVSPLARRGVRAVLKRTRAALTRATFL
jgi:hypothetical protein